MNYFLVKLILCFVVVCLKNIIYCEIIERTDLLESKLKFVHVLYRHGDRTPIRPYKNDPWADPKHWPVGFGQLTNLGKQQQYELGKWLRQRYQNFINETYSENEFYIQSSDVDRTLMSAYSNLAGFYPPINDQIWNKYLNWQPIPVHTIPESMDFIIASKKTCPAYDEAFDELMQSDDFVKKSVKFQRIYESLTANSGEDIRSIKNVSQLLDTIFVENLYKKELPDWAARVLTNGEIERISKLSFKLDSYTPKLAKYSCGFLLKDILDRFTNKTLGLLDPDRSMWVYSGHDTTISRFLNTLGLFDSHIPQYTACVMLELRIVKNVPVIEIYYKTSSKTNEAIQLPIPNCGDSCPLNKMYELYGNVIPKNDFDIECQADESNWLEARSSSDKIGDYSWIGVATAAFYFLQFLLM